MNPVHKDIVTVDHLHAKPTLWYKLTVFLFDLRNFSSNEASRTRLQNVIGEFHLGEPYFTTDETSLLLRTMIDDSGGVTLKDAISDFFAKKLETRVRGRVKSTGEWTVCAAHDLAPVFERAFGVRVKELSRDKVFKKLMQKRGLDVSDDGAMWTRDRT